MPTANHSTIPPEIASRILHDSQKIARVVCAASPHTNGRPDQIDDVAGKIALQACLLWAALPTQDRATRFLPTFYRYAKANGYHFLSSRTTRSREALVHDPQKSAEHDLIDPFDIQLEAEKAELHKFLHALSGQHPLIDVYLAGDETDRTTRRRWYESPLRRHLRNNKHLQELAGVA